MLLSLELFVLLVMANGVPVVVARLFQHHGDWPVDAGLTWGDGRPLLGPSKTWRGLASGTLAGSLFSIWFELGWFFGAFFGALSLLGDLLSSFIKRRVGMGSSARAVWLDQLPEAVLPMFMAWLWFPLPLWEAAAIAVLFALSNMLFSPLLYRLGIRKQPH
ncbi:MAG: CDP-archaeol synthase [Gammaproteobacteria bacterium]|uniref:CDP-archaeol synthase n=1 Tax=Marinobacter sp. SBS5 TaxID=3401754 RepID=UPI003AAD9F97|nr:CDP-archaeol synthase [Gammaproteobacteria bacterium]